MLTLIACVLLVAAIISYRMWVKRLERQRLLDSPLTDADRAIIDTHVPMIRRLPSRFRAMLEGKVNLFLEQVTFQGCDGLEVTEEMELSIAAQACLLVVNSNLWYENLTTVLIYPGAFKSRQHRHSGYVVTEQEIIRTGESWDRGPVILSWAHSQQGAMDDRDGHNVVLHEFAHQLDDLTGSTNGVPVLSEGQTFARWERVFLSAYETLVERVEKGRYSVIDPYGATGHEEFFAVSVEVFFEKPVELNLEFPEVYEQLSNLFRLDPISWG